MTKEIVNNRIIYTNVYGRVAAHDLLLGQAVNITDSPTFSNLTLTGDAQINGNLYVDGNTTILNSNIIEFEDNIILVNRNETGVGVTLNQSGLEVERGTLDNVRIIWNELTDRIEVGEISNLEPITIRESDPLDNGVMIWDEVNKRINSSDEISINLKLLSTENSISSTTGSLILYGGLGVDKDVSINGKINLGNSKLESVSSTLYITTGNLNLPYNTPINFGINKNAIVANTSNNLIIKSDNNINLSTTNGNIIIPNSTKLIFSTTSESIYSDISNNVIINSSADINLNPLDKVFIPLNIPLVFNNVNQSILGNISNDLEINAGNDILLTPGNNLNVKIPTDNGILFGNTGIQRIYADSNNDLFIKSSNDINLSPSTGNHVNIPENIPITFTDYLQYIKGDTNGNLILGAANEINYMSPIYITSTINSINSSTGAIHTDGGIGVKKDIVSEGTIKVLNSLNESLLNVQNIFEVNKSSNGNIKVNSGNGVTPSLVLDPLSSVSDGYNLLQLKTVYDTVGSYMIGRGSTSLNNGRVLTINIPKYFEYNSVGVMPRLSITTNDTNDELFRIESENGNIRSIGITTIENTTESLSVTSGSLILHGGLGVQKNIYTSGKVNIKVDDLSALLIQDNGSNTLLNIDSINNSISIINDKIVINDTGYTSELSYSITNTTNSTNTSNGSMVLNGGMAVQKNINVGGVGTFNNNINMSNNKIINVSNPSDLQDVATKAYVDAVKQGLNIKEAVKCVSILSLNVNTDVVIGQTIDNYVLTNNDRVLLINQTNAVENGIYQVTNTTPIRPLDFDTGDSASGAFVFSIEGNLMKYIGFICYTLSPNDIIDTNNINFTQFSALGQVIAGNGLSKTYNEIYVNVDNSSLEINSDQLRISANGIGTGLTGGSGLTLQTLSDQSHVTKLGTINTGVWEGSTVGVLYGGTGRSSFTQGCILFGNGNNPININTNLFYDNSNVRLGIGTSNPSNEIEIKKADNVTLYLNADADNNNSAAKPEIKLSYAGNKVGYISMPRIYNDIANGIYPGSIVISNQQTDSTSIIQLATNLESRLTILQNGNIGINTSNPTYTLDIKGNLRINSSIESTNSSSGGVVILSGVGINNSTNAVNISNGGALTIAGGVSIAKDLYVGGEIYSTNGINVTNTDDAINLSTGSLILSGGLTIKSSSNALSYTNGGSLLTPGGGAIGKDLYVGDTLIVKNGGYINNIYITSDGSKNYIESPNTSRTTNSFIPINFTEYNNTQSNIFTIYNNGLILNNDKILRIGGDYENIDGYNINFTNSNLNIIQNNTNTSYNVNVGTVGAYSNINVYGTSGSMISWESLNRDILLKNLSIKLKEISTSNSINWETPDVNSTSYVRAVGDDMILSFGGTSTGGQLITKFSNSLETSSITFTPSNSTYSTFIITDNVYSTYNGPVLLNDRVEYKGKGLKQDISNNTNNNVWIYFGIINDSNKGFTEIKVSNGIKDTVDVSGLEMYISISDTTLSCSHTHIGNLLYDSIEKPRGYIYRDTNDDYHLFMLLASYSETDINIYSQNGIKYLLRNEGTGVEPDGTYSNFDNINWILEYSSVSESTLKQTFGDVTVEGNNLKIADNIPIVGYNNSYITNSRDLGILYERYQKANDLAEGDIVAPSEIPILIDSLPSQTGIISLSQFKLSSLASAIDNYYNGMWIKILSGSNINQVRQVLSYNGSLKVVTLVTPFTTQNPSLGDTVYIYNRIYVSNYYDTINNKFTLGYVNKNSDDYLDLIDNADLSLRKLYSSDIAESINSTIGSILLNGGISINNTSYAISSTHGGTLTTDGGIGIKKNLIVGDKIGVGTSGFNLDESLHILQSKASIKLEHSDNYSYIDFVKNQNTNIHYGIIYDSQINQLCLTNATSNITPDVSFKALTLNSMGNIGIHTTSDVVSPLAINNSNFISTNSSIGYLGIIGGASNVNDGNVASRIILNANSTNDGSLELYAGNISSGNVSIYTNNDIERIRVEYNGVVNIYNSITSDNTSQGALLLSGGLTIKSTENASSVTDGGTILTRGGGSIGKDLYVGGNLYVSGLLIGSGNVTTGTLNVISYTNCSTFVDTDVHININGSLGILTFMFTIIPDNASENCEVELELPSRSTNFVRPYEVISACSGHESNTNYTPLFNVLAYGVMGTTHLNIKFQSISTNIHYFQVQSTYLLE